MRILIGLSTLAILVAFAFVALDPSYQRQRADAAYFSRERAALQLERERLVLEQERQRAEQLAPVRTLTSAVLTLAVPAVGLLVVVAACSLGIDAYRRRTWRADLVRPDALGRLPIERWELSSTAPAALQAYHQVQALAAQRPNVPTSLHYAPHFSNRQDVDGSALPELPQLSAGVPTFADLLNAGKVGKGNPMLLGYADGQPLIGDWRDLYSSAVAGVSGSGKTTTLRFLACQSSLHGAKWVLLDPHADAGDDSLAGTLAPLSSAFVCAPASNPKTMLASVQLVADEMNRRLSNSHAERWPLVLAADEFTSLMRGDLAEPLAALIEGIAQQGRKVLVFALISGQIFTAERTGGSALRDSLASCYIHRMKRRQANHLLQLGDELPETLTLETGRALLYRTSGELLMVAVPNCTSTDVERVGRLLTDAQPTTERLPAVTSGTPQGTISTPNRTGIEPELNQNVTEGARLHSAAVSGSVASAEAMRAAGLFMQGLSIADIVRELRGSLRGASYQKAADEVQQLVRAGLVQR